MHRIGVWGQFGNGGKIADGQAVRTTIITDELRRRYGASAIQTVNTNAWRSHPLKFLWDSIKLVATSQNVVIAPADNGYKVFVPILIFINFFYRRRLIHIVIGGFLPALLKEQPKYLRMENKFYAVFVQTENLLKDLQKLGVKNLHISSNLKRLNTRNKSDLHIFDEKELKVCVFSRINKEKGVEEAIEAVKLVNIKLGRELVKLDLYGLIQPGIESWLELLIRNNSSFVEYKGIVDYNKTVETLQQYFVMLFPTFYYGEGFPGNVIDAYNTGLPMIATDWLYNKEVIKDGRNGILVPTKDVQALADAILKLYNDRQLQYTYAMNCLEDAEQYKPEEVLKELYMIMDE